MKIIRGRERAENHFFMASIIGELKDRKISENSDGRLFYFKSLAQIMFFD